MKQNTFFYSCCLGGLVVLFAVYNFTVYKVPTKQKLSAKALSGQQIWQSNNCFDCHQLYGLGGYLGPDLTNIYSNPNKGPRYITAMLNSGVKTMPVFHFSKEETEALLAFLQEVDKTGQYPNYNANLEPNGWVEITTTHEK